MEIQILPDLVGDDRLLHEVIEIKIQVAALKLKKRVLLEELYRQFFEGEKEPKKRKRREIKQDEVGAAAEYESNEISSTATGNSVAKKRRRRVSGTAALVPSNET